MLRRLATAAARPPGGRGAALARARGFASSDASGGWFGRGGPPAGTPGSNAAGPLASDANVPSTSAPPDISPASADAAPSWVSSALMTSAEPGSSSLPGVMTTPSLFSDPVGLAAFALEHAHHASGLPWWTVIAGSAVAVRCALFPLTLKQAKAAALLNAAVARARGPDGEPPRSPRDVLAAASELRRRVDGVRLRWLVAAPLAQIPAFLCAVFAVRRVIATSSTAASGGASSSIGLETGGALWFVDLTQAAVDLATFSAPMGVAGAALPCAVAAALFANVNASWGGAAAKSRVAGSVKLLMEWLAVPTLVIGMQLPQGVLVYWLAGSLAALAQGAAMRAPAIRAALKVEPDLARAAFAAAAKERTHIGGVGRDGDRPRGSSNGSGVEGVTPNPVEEGLARGREGGFSSAEVVSEGPWITATERSGNTPGNTASGGAAAFLRFSRPLTDEEAALLREAAEARAGDDPKRAAALLERAAALGGGGRASASANERERASPSGEAGVEGSEASSRASASAGSEASSSVPSSRLADAHPTVLYALAQTRHKLRRWAEAAAAYDACAAAETNVALRARALSGAGVAKAKAGDVEGAARALETAVALRPEDAGAGVSLAAVRKSAGDLEGALEALEKAARVAPEVRERFVAPLEREMERRKEGKRAAGKQGKQGKQGKRRE